MRTVRFLSILFAAAGMVFTQSIAAQGGGQRGGMRQQSSMPRPKVVTRDGRPTLEFEGQNGWSFYISFGQHQGEPSLGFPVIEGSCQGFLYVTRTRVSGDFRNTSCQSFDVPRSSSTAQRQLGTVVVTSGAAKYEVSPAGERDGQRREIRGMSNGSEFVVRAVNNFEMVFRTLHRMAVEARDTNPAPAVTATKTAPAATKQQQPATLAITSDPGDVQVFVNDAQRGITSSEGKAVLQLPAGAYKVRLSLPGYKDWKQQVSLVTGKTQNVSAKLEAEGPPPFSEKDVSEMLEGKMSSKRIATLVEERGVDFDLSPDLEKHLRAIGGTSDLLLAIAEHKKK